MTELPNELISGAPVDELIPHVLTSLLEMSVSGPRDRGEVFRDDIGTHLIDTAIPSDTRVWETGVKPVSDEWVIVSQYKTMEDARNGHDAWVNALKLDPKTELKDINIYGLAEDDD